MEETFDDEEMELPPGFRFHPTDEELISHYLRPKVFDPNFVAKAIADVDLNKVEPWDLPWRAKLGEKEWYFFCVRDRKYPTGSRTNRATDAGYWKATGKDKEIHKANSLVGMKKTLVFYKGRAPRGLKTNWVMHEYRLEGNFAVNNLPPSPKGEWVISRVFHKNSGGEKISISGLLRMNKNNHEHQFDSSNLPPLLDINGGTRTTTNTETSHVTCFSESMEEQKPNNEDMIEISNKCIHSKMDNNVSSISNTCFLPNKMVPNVENYQYQETDWLQDPNVLRLLIDDNNNPNMPQIPKAELFANQDYSMNLAGEVDDDFLWNY